MNSKYKFFYKSMIAFLVSAVFFTGCKHDASSIEGFNSVNNSVESNSANATTDSNGVSAFASTAKATLLLDNNFDGTSPFAGFTLANQQFCCSYSITQATSPDGAGGNSLKFDLRSTDAIVSSSKRAEIQLAGTDAPATSERWYGLRYWLSKYDADNGAESLLQWHDQDGTTPPLSLQVSGGRMNFCQSFTSNTHYDIGATTLNKWINIVIHVKWTTSNTGVLEVWRDGSKLVSKTNVRTNSNGGSYMKIGINKWSWAPGGGSSTATQRIFYIDNFKMGAETATYADVDPTSTGGGTTPPP
ncbi:MAG: polysaccharide lyase, partial [Chitinophagaceae bacterium]